MGDRVHMKCTGLKRAPKSKQKVMLGGGWRPMKSCSGGNQSPGVRIIFSSLSIQRWALLLSSYRYHISYKAGKLHANADCLSRLPVQDARNPGVKFKGRRCSCLKRCPVAGNKGYGGAYR